MRRLLLLTAAIFFAAACGGPAANNSAPHNVNAASAAAPVETPVKPTPMANPPDETTDTADFEGTAGITEKKYPNIKAPAIMSDVRTARHGNYDRVVFEFLGAEMPTYHVEYIDRPVRSCGSGEVVPFAGDGWLEVRFTDSQAHAPEGDATIKDRSRSPNLPVIKDLKITCDFEGEVTWVLGLGSPNRYRVIELKDPTRLALDIKH